MPTLAPRVCACGRVVASGVLCACQIERDRARKARFDARRPSARERGYDSKWQRESKAFLALPENRLCACGCSRPASLVDHKIPHRGDKRLLEPVQLAAHVHALSLRPEAIGRTSGRAMSKERILWVNVILQAVKDGTTECGGAPGERLRARARAWFNPTSRDFIEVCSLAGLDPDATCERANAAFARYDDTAARGERFKPAPAPTIPNRERIHYVHQGKSLTVAQWSTVTGIALGTLRSRLSRGVPIAQAIDPDYLAKFGKPRGRRAQMKLRPVERYKGKTLSEWSSVTGIPVPTIRYRLDKGMTIEHALSSRALSRQALPHSINGVSKTLSEWADYAGVAYDTLIQRMVTGKRTLAEAVAMGSRGVGVNLPTAPGTGGGSVAQERAEIDFSASTGNPAP